MGVVGSTLPVRFPECLRLPDCTVTPFAIQPGQVLMPENCGVALRVDGPAGTWFAVWRPADRQLLQLPAPEGWLTGTGLWTEDGVLRLPYTTREVPCGVARFAVPRGGENGARGQGGPPGHWGNGETRPGIRSGTGRGCAWEAAPAPSPPSPPDPPVPAAPRPVPLREAPLKGRVAVG